MADKEAVSAQGCYVDSSQERDLPVQVLVGASDMTIEACISACASSPYMYRFAAVQVYQSINHLFESGRAIRNETPKHKITHAEKQERQERQ